MSVAEIKAEIVRLPEADRSELADWFAEIQNEAWDREIARDAKAGRFDALLKQAREQVAAGQTRPL